MDNKLKRDHFNSLIDAIIVESKILRVTVPNIRDTTNMAKITAFSDSVKRLCTKSLHTRFIHSLARTHRYCMRTCPVSVPMLCGLI